MKNNIKIDGLWLSFVVLISSLLILFEETFELGDLHFEALDGYVYIPYSPVIAVALLLVNLIYFAVREAYNKYSRKAFTWLLLGLNTTVLLTVAYVYYAIIILSFMFLFIDITDITGRDPAQIEQAYSEARFVRSTALVILAILVLHELWLIYKLINKKRWLTTAINHVASRHAS